MSDKTVRIRIDGDADAVAAVADLIRPMLPAAHESRDLANDCNLSHAVRRYFNVRVAVGLPVPVRDVPLQEAPDRLSAEEEARQAQRLQRFRY